MSFIFFLIVFHMHGLKIYTYVKKWALDNAVFATLGLYTE